MRKICFILLIFTVLHPSLSAKNKGIEYGLEWGAGMRYITYSDFNFKSEEGMIVKGDEYLYPIHYSGLIFAHINYCLDSNFAITSTLGWMGQKENIRVVPVLVGADYSLNKNQSQLLFGEIGLGIPTHGLMKPSKILRAGYAHNFDIGFNTGIQFRLAATMSSLNPKRTSYAGKLLDKSYLFNNHMYYAGLELSMAIYFQ